jgi:hypothetical protein
MAIDGRLAGVVKTTEMQRFLRGDFLIESRGSRHWDA